jgi:elongation factor P
LVSFSTSDFKPGLKVIIDNAPCSIIEDEFVKPGKGQAFSKIKYRNLLTGRVGEKTCKVGESLESADVTEYEMQYLYNDGNEWFFMNSQTYDQVGLNKNLISSTSNWLKEEDIYKLTFWDNNPIMIQAPNFVDLEVTQTDPGLKGDTAQGGTKPATLSTGIVVKVPLFVSEGEVITIDTRTGEYQGRSK